MSAPPFSLAGKTAFVTGGNRGLGLGMALGLAGAGADVAIACRDLDKAGKAIEAVEETGARALAVACDVTSPASIAEAVGRTRAGLGPIGILVNNSGTSCRFRPEETPDDEWDRVIDTNLKGPFMVAKAVYPQMKELGRGKVINIASMNAIFGGPNDTAYAPSKGGIVQLSKVLAIAWAKDNIQVNSLYPGWHYTDMTRSYLKTFPDQEATIEARTPAGRWGTPEDLAGPAVFLASAASDFVTGASLVVDGGYSIN